MPRLPKKSPNFFVECIAAPGFADRAKEIFAAKKNLRLLELPAGGLEPERELQLKRILGGMLVQQPDLGEIKDDELRTVTKRVPTAEEMQTMRFAWIVAKHVKSNAIVFAKAGATLGVGAGQMSRVDSGENRGDESAIFPGRRRGRFRRIFSLSRWSGRSGQGRRDRRQSSRAVLSAMLMS